MGNRTEQNRTEQKSSVPSFIKEERETFHPLLRVYISLFLKSVQGKFTKYTVSQIVVEATIVEGTRISCIHPMNNLVQLAYV